MQPTPTRSPTAYFVTPGPTSETTPAISWPGTIGKIASPQPSLTWWMSEWQMPHEMDVDEDVVLADRASLDRGALERCLGGGRGVCGDSGHDLGFSAVS